MDPTIISGRIAEMQPIMLPDISAVRFMNRTDSKFLIPAARIPDLFAMLDNRYRILEINDRRALPYSTTYYDTADNLLFFHHVRKKAIRYKLRFRTYESSGDTFLEIKKKTLDNRTSKLRIPACYSPDAFDRDALNFIHKNFPLDPELLSNSLMNSFMRITLAGLETNERVTIDYNLQFSDPRNKSSIELPHLSVVELKREGLAVMSPFYLMLRHLNSYPTGFSKYAVGKALLNENLRRNALRHKIIRLQKIENEHQKANSTPV